MSSMVQDAYDMGITTSLGGMPSDSFYENNDYSNERNRKSYDNSTKQTCAQRKSPTKHNGKWYDAGGNEVKDTDAYFKEIESNGKRWEKCDSD